MEELGARVQGQGVCNRRAGEKKRSHEYNVGKLVFGYEFSDLENGT